ncbi:MAG: hypothetical protein GY756_06175 [bacterium]|nr:hypothetical protein [bacterium]
MPEKILKYKKIFGLNLVEHSEDLHLTKNDDSEITVSISKMKSQQDNVLKYCCSMSENLLELELPKLGSFRAEEGNKITIDHNTDIEPSEILPFLYGTCMGASLYQRGIIPLHGSAVLTEKGVVLFLGVAGAGKSTTAAALMQRGYSIISDDISAVRLIGKNAELIPSNTDLKLWKRSLDMLNKTQEGLIPVRNKLEKYYLPLKTEYANKSYPVHKIYILDTHNEEFIEFSEPLKGKEKFNRIKNHAYRKKFIKGLNRHKEYFSTMMYLLTKAEVKTVTRPKSGYLKELIDIIEEDMLR